MIFIIRCKQKYCPDNPGCRAQIRAIARGGGKTMFSAQPLPANQNFMIRF
jgi:hypothetical protein